jgi:hypothetical protein
LSSSNTVTVSKGGCSLLRWRRCIDKARCDVVYT